jgi:AAA15 family ATPase/GTPase
MNEHFLTDIEIKQFKCFTDFKADGFKRVNLIGGKNNIGKTAFMEACYINVCGNNVDDLIATIVGIKYMRENLNFLEKPANKLILLDSTKLYNSSSNIIDKSFIIKEKNGKKEYRLGIDSTETLINANEIAIGFFMISNIKFIDNFGWTNDDLSYAFQDIQKSDKEDELNNYINEFDNSIENFKIIGNQPQCKVNNNYRDLNEFGDGLKHYISIFCALISCENGYLFIDEIDNGIHYTQLDRLWEIILTI